MQELHHEVRKLCLPDLHHELPKLCHSELHHEVLELCHPDIQSGKVIPDLPADENTEVRQDLLPEITSTEVHHHPDYLITTEVHQEDLPNENT